VTTQFDLLAHLYATSSKSRIRPFLTAGLGAGIFPDQSAFYAPVGTGLQINFNEGASLLLQAQLRNKLSKGITNNFLFYQIGISQSLSRKKAKKETKFEPLVEKKTTEPVQPADTDQDGISDAEDQCPLEKGTINGCPDSDADNISNRNDSCPTIPGLIKYHGCPIPDSDGDGVDNEKDKCPTTPGIATNNGCPEIKEEIKQQVNYSAQNILFLFASSTLSPSSYKPLNELIHVLNENPLLKLKIEAHTDSIGTAENNQRLSENRAKSVADYLLKKGISSERLTWFGLGETKPIADNSTEKGRAKNRRVEFILSYE
jgi:outer membrane protein OmpA-like peptidoglycan-associated protein